MSSYHNWMLATDMYILPTGNMLIPGSRECQSRWSTIPLDLYSGICTELEPAWAVSTDVLIILIITYSYTDMIVQSLA